MKKVIVTLFLIVLFAISTNAQSKGFGLGIVIGEPTGISAKLWTGSTTAFQGAIAWAFGNNNSIRLQADHLWHFPGIAVSSGKLPWYVGLGAGITLADELKLGVRIPVGLDYQFATVPLDLFFELVPALNLIPNVDLNINAGLGIRYFF